MTYHSSSVAEKRTRQFLKPFILSPINLSITIYSIHLQKHLFIYKKNISILSLSLSPYPYILFYLCCTLNTGKIIDFSVLCLTSSCTYCREIDFHFIIRETNVSAAYRMCYIWKYTRWSRSEIGIQDVRAVEVSFDDDFYKIPGNFT